MNIAIHINETTILNIQTYGIIEKKISEPVVDGQKYNFDIYSFYFLVKSNMIIDELEGFDLIKHRRLYYKLFNIETENGNKYTLVRAITDDLEGAKEAIEKLMNNNHHKDYTIVNQNIELINIINLNEYFLGKFIDTEVDQGVLPFS
jgi:hypothetical protein